MDREALFVNTMDDLRRRIADGVSEYDLLMAAPLLRKLLLEETPLIFDVNRARREDIAFVIQRQTALDREIMKDGPVFYAQLEAFSPRWPMPAGNSQQRLKLEKFLDAKVAFAFGHSVMVKDVIGQLAHVDGGVHVRQPKTEVEQALHRSSEMIQAGGAAATAAMVRGIAAVTLDGLAALETRVRRDRGQVSAPETDRADG